ncbi:MAG: HAD-IB family phosphatase [Actinomycetota bacterium]|nr:HAD-IB family phosphatase [Actinomycetota bacterium]
MPRPDLLETGPRGLTIVLDWDGTVTERDSLNMVLERFGDPDVYDEAERGLGKGMTLREVMDFEFSGLRAPLDEVVDWMLANVRIRPGFREFAERHDPLILSSSFVETIEPLLEREGVRLDVVANTVDARPDGWRIRWRDETVCDHCDESCKRAALPQGRPVVFVGDGYSDRCAALAADRVFARDGLARYLAERGVPFEPFVGFPELDSALAC